LSSIGAAAVAAWQQGTGPGLKGRGAGTGQQLQPRAAGVTVSDNSSAPPGLRPTTATINSNRDSQWLVVRLQLVSGPALQAAAGVSALQTTAAAAGGQGARAVHSRLVGRSAGPVGCGSAPGQMRPQQPAHTAAGRTQL
jgi:hypothetical protein